MIKEKYVENVKEISLNITQTKIDSVRKKDITKTGIRVYKDGYVGFAGEIGKVDEDELEKKAIKSLEDRFEYPYKVSKNKSITGDYSNELVIEDVVAEFDEVMSIIEDSHPDFSFANKINVVEIERSISNSENLNLKYKDKFMEFGITVKDKKSLNIFDTIILGVSRIYDRKLFLDYVNKMCSGFKNKVEFNGTKKMPVIFRDSEAHPLNKFIGDLNGGIFGSNSSLLSDKLGKKAFSKDFTLYQDNNPKENPICFFDDEGVVNDNYKYTLIENGVVKSPFTDKKTSEKYNLPLTGAGLCEYDGIPSLGLSDFNMLRIKESDKSIKELLNGEVGILVDISMGGDFTADGNYGAPVQVAYLFDGENILGRLSELIISSNIFDMFGKDFVGLSKDGSDKMFNHKYLVMNMEVDRIQM